MGTTSSEYRTAKYIFHNYVGTAGMLLHLNGKFTMGKFTSSLQVMSISRFLSRYKADLAAPAVSFISSSMG